jgi:hypothetical protein
MVGKILSMFSQACGFTTFTFYRPARSCWVISIRICSAIDPPLWRSNLWTAARTIKMFSHGIFSPSASYTGRSPNFSTGDLM